MRLTGEAKEEFYKWLNHKSGLSQYKYTFSGLSPSMQWGVYQDWADSIGYLVEILVVPIENTLYRFEFDFTIYNQNEQIEISELGCKTRQEARNAAIEKLNEIVNEK